MKATRKLIPALALLIVSAVIMSTASYAWFSMNREVSATGMEVNVVVESSLLIAPAEKAAVATVADNLFVKDLTQERKGMLEPVSTIDGAAFFYTGTTNAAADGNAITETYVAYNEAAALADTAAGKTNYDAAFNTNYGITTPAVDNVAYGYIDYEFQLKAINTKATAQMININNLELTYAGDTDASKAYRVAVFVEEEVAAAPKTFAANIGTLKTILSPTGAVNQAAGLAVDSATTATGTVLQPNTKATLATIAANANKYYKVVVRLYLEGEDTTCTNTTFMTLTEDWNLDLGIELADDATNAVSALATTVTP